MLPRIRTGSKTALTQSRADGHVMPGGWDHEHREICWPQIGSGGDAEGYVTGVDQWVCTFCYARYVERRDLPFVPDSPSGDEDQTPKM